MKSFFKGFGIIVGLFVVAIIVVAISPQIGMATAAALLLVPLAAFFKPMPSLGLTHRGFCLALAFFVGIPTLLAVVGMNAQAEQLAALKQSDPAAYLAEVKATDQANYLSELAEIDPERHKAELQRIATEEAQRTAALQAAEAAKAAEQAAAALATKAEEDARRADAERAETELYLEQLDSELASLPGVSASKFTGSVSEINLGLVLIGTWNLLYENGSGLNLDAEGQKKRQRFKDLLIRKQAEMFPALRDAYGPAMRSQLWEADGSARTLGAGYRTVEFVSGAFARNANIKQIHTEMFENLLMLRFTRAQYKWFDQASEFSYYTLEPPKDTDLVKWDSGARFQLLN